mgnify:CR=1 FL=1
MRNLIVVGGSGYLGRNIVCDLKSNYDNIFIISRSRQNERTKKGITHLTFDILKHKWDDSLSICFNNTADIALTAWPSLHDYNDNIHFTFARSLKRFFDQILNFSPRKIYISGTCFEYSKLSKDIRVLDELKGRNKYAKAKVWSYNSLLKSFKENLIGNTSVLYQRIWYLYGRENSSRSLLSMIDNLNRLGKQNNRVENLDLNSNGEQFLDYVKIDDIISEIKEFFSTDDLNKSFIVSNGCSGIPVKLKNFIEEYCHENQINNVRLNWKKDLSKSNYSFYGRKEKIFIK